jgi:hypothetical protein
MPNNNMAPAEPELTDYTLTYSDGSTQTVEGVAVMAIGDGGYEFYARPSDYYGVDAADLKPMDTAPAGATLAEVRNPMVKDTEIVAVTEVDNPDQVTVADDGFPVLQTANMADPFGLRGNR